MPLDCLRIIKSKSKVHNSRNKPVVTKVSASNSTPGISPDVAELKDMVKALLLDKKNQSQAPAPVKAVEENYVTCGGTHSYRNCPATDGNVYRDNIQEYVSQAAAANFNQGNTGYRASIANQIRPPGSGTLPSNTITNPKVYLKGITTRSGVAYQGPTIPTTSYSLPKVVEHETKVTKDTVPPTNNGSTKDVQPPVVQVQPQVPNSEPYVAPVIIIEYLVNISKRRAFWSLNEDILKINDSDYQYAVSIKEYTAYPCLHSPKTTKETRSICLRMTKIIKGEFEKLIDVKVEDVSLTCDTSLEVFNNEINRLNEMDDDLFTYEVKVANIECGSNVDDDSERGVSHDTDDDMGYDPSDVAFTEWLRGDDELELTDEESFDSEDEVAEVFRIDTNIFDFETLMCKAFKEFNYLVQIDPDLLTKDIEGFKTYEDYKDDWIYEWNENVP
ncbi:hypothetical protein Tco_1264137 [Tanacetum coccineum]